ncbi:unnamed protein product [Closterium sp. NIES-64]|nr:unnamed protein product [Closterium sp. NIES-64]
MLPPQQSAELAPLSGAAVERLGDATEIFRGPAADVAGVGLRWYYLVRAGESEWEALGLIHTNPVDKTNVQSGLSGEGKKQAVEAARKLRKMDACGGGCWIWPSISQRAYQTAEVVAYVNGADYSRIVPEYSFLDARGLGAFEGQPLEMMSEVGVVVGESLWQSWGEVWCTKKTVSSRWRPRPCTDGTTHESIPDVLIYLENSVSSRWRPPPFTDGTPHESVADMLIYLEDSVSSRWRPPAFTDGTPHESVADVLVRVTQLMSILETQYSRDAVVIVSPDSDCLSVLQAALIGKDLRRPRPSLCPHLAVSLYAPCHSLPMVLLNDARNSLPNDARNSLPNDARNSLPNDARNSLPNDARNSLPNDARNSLPNDARNSLPNDARNSLPNDARNSLPNDARNSLPNDARNSLPNDARNSLPNDARNSLPNDARNSLPNDARNSLPNDARNSLPNDARNSLPNDARNSLPNDARNSLPNDARNSLPNDARNSLPNDARNSLPNDARNSLPNDARNSLPNDARNSLPNDARNSLPNDAPP